jgi:uncharacterized RDD family membrane protein YckC
MSEKKTKAVEPTVKPKREISILKALKANVIDILIIVVISISVLLIGDFILRSFFGLFVSDLISMLLLLIIIVSVIYNTLMQSSRKRGTLGERASKIIIANGEGKSEKR